MCRTLLPIPLAPANEQQRIADVLDELLSDLDAGVAALEAVRVKLGHYRAAVLKAAVDGSLTAEWRKQHPDAEPASELLKRILIERRKRWEQEQRRKYADAGKQPPPNWKAKYKEPVSPDAIELPDLPENWIVASADALMSRITSGSRDWQQYYGKGTGTFIMAQNVRPGRLDLSWRQEVDPPPGDTSCERSQVELADLLVTIVGAKTGDVCRVREKLRQHYVCQSVTLMRPAVTDVSAFLEIYFTCSAGAQFHYRRYIYGAGRPHLSFDQLKMTPVILPPLAEQDAIVEAVEDQLSVIDHLEADLDAKLKAAQGLRQSILRHAFSGKLVPQDPSDEPASELLKRIAAERAEQERSAAAEKNTRRTKKPKRKTKAK